VLVFANPSLGLQLPAGNALKFATAGSYFTSGNGLGAIRPKSCARFPRRRPYLLVEGAVRARKSDGVEQPDAQSVDVGLTRRDSALFRVSARFSSPIRHLCRIVRTEFAATECLVRKPATHLCNRSPFPRGLVDLLLSFHPPTYPPPRAEFNSSAISIAFLGARELAIRRFVI
jgi:hypothetical protein